MRDCGRVPGLEGVGTDARAHERVRDSDTPRGQPESSINHRYRRLIDVIDLCVIIGSKSGFDFC